jgi:hypothetical protein
MRRSIFLPLLVVLVCSVSLVPPVYADTADIPALTGTGTGNATAHFIAAWVTLDGGTQVGGATVFSALFGDSAARTTETDVIAGAPFAYNVTNLRITSGPANCGNLANAGETFTIVLRKNGAATALTGTCVFGAAAGSFTLDTDIVSILPGDDLSFSIALTGTVLTRSARMSFTMDGYKLAPVTTQVTTDPVIDMVNELLEVVNLIAPITLMILALIWAELSKEWLVYVLAAVAGIQAVVTLWNEVESLRVILAAAIVLILARGYFAYTLSPQEEDAE